MEIKTSAIGMILLLSILIFTKCENDNPSSSNNLDSTIILHFKSIQNRDINTLMKTVCDSNITLILPNGKYSKSSSNYISINEKWFADKNWHIEYDILEKIVNRDIGIVSTKITYHDKNLNGDDYSYEYFLTLIFRDINNEWKLTFDQNTLIR